MAKKRKNVDPDAPPPPQWTPPTDDVEWRDWMKDGFWSSDDLRKYGVAHSAKASFKTPFPVFVGPDRVSLQARGHGVRRGGRRLRAPHGRVVRGPDHLQPAHRGEEGGVRP